MAEVDFEVDQVDSIVLGAAEDAARREGLVLSSEAKDYLLRAARPQLDAALDRGELEKLRTDAVQATVMLIEEVAELHRRSDAITSEISLGAIDDALEVLCSKVPYLYPICPRPPK
jgi:hypothetical protein